jgi:hypothetical protein
VAKLSDNWLGSAARKSAHQVEAITTNAEIAPTSALRLFFNSPAPDRFDVRPKELIAFILPSKHGWDD